MTFLLYAWPGISRGVILHAVQSDKAPGGQGTRGRCDRKSQVHAEWQPAAARGRGVPHTGQNTHTWNTQSVLICQQCWSHDITVKEIQCVLLTTLKFSCFFSTPLFLFLVTLSVCSRYLLLCVWRNMYKFFSFSQTNCKCELFLYFNLRYWKFSRIYVKMNHSLHCCIHQFSPVITPLVYMSRL